MYKKKLSRYKTHCMSAWQDVVAFPRQHMYTWNRLICCLVDHGSPTENFCHYLKAKSEKINIGLCCLGYPSEILGDRRDRLSITSSMYCNFRRRRIKAFSETEGGGLWFGTQGQGNRRILIDCMVKQYSCWQIHMFCLFTPVTIMLQNTRNNYLKHETALEFIFQKHAYTHIHTDTHLTPSVPLPLRAKQAPSSFNVSSSIDPLLKPLPWVGIGQIQSHTGQFITEPQTLSLTVRKEERRERRRRNW